MTTAINALRLTGRTLMLARAFWLLLAVPTIGLLLYSAIQGRPLVARLVDSGWTPEAYGTAVAQTGLPPNGLDLLYNLSTLVSRLTFIGVCLVLFRRSDDGMAYLTSLTLLTFSITAAGVAELPPGWSGLSAIVTFIQAFGQSCLFLFIFMFPNGRFVPGWVRWPTLAAIFVVSIIARMASLRDLPPVFALILLATLWLLLSALPAQAYRYRRVSTPTERQQAKLVLFGISIFLIGGAGSWLVGDLVVPALIPTAEPLLGTGARLVYDFVRVELQVLPATALPLTLGVAVLRYRLWDIDLIIRRTLVYSALSAVLALAYFGSVLVLQNIFQAVTGESRSAWVTVLSTLAIAALFGPLRGRVQQAIDRRFYRQKYDAARTLAAFGAQARDVVEREQLSDQLIAAVDETMQPAHVGLWLRASSREHEGRRI